MSSRTVKNSDICKECGGKCCKYIMLETFKEDEYKLEFWKAQGNIKVHESDTHVVYMQNAACQHSQEDGRCAIYENRPQLCREFPTRGLPRLWRLVCPLHKELYEEDSILKVF